MIKNILISLLLFVHPSERQIDTDQNNIFYEEDNLYPLAPSGLKRCIRQNLEMQVLRAILIR